MLIKDSVTERRLHTLLAKVNCVRTINELHRVAQFRHNIYVKEQRKKSNWACHDFEVLIEPADIAPNSRVLYIEENGNIVGSLRMEFEPINDTCSMNFQIPALRAQKSDLRFSLISRLMTNSNVRQQSLVTSALFSACVDRSAEMQHSIGLISCKPSLVQFFRECGFLQYADLFKHADAGEQVPMINIVAPEYLSRFSSLWALSASRHQCTFSEYEWFYSITKPFLNLNYK